MSEIELHREQTVAPFASQVEQAKLLSAGSMLPGEYRNQPANVLIAMNLGQAMGLSPAESLYRIAVIKGKPTASAELIASNVRKAGHRLRVVVDEQAVAATATIVRVDDPDFEFAVTRDMKWARDMGLAGNDNYKRQPLTMLANRAITAAARLACPETLYGVAYSPDEMHEAQEARRGGLAAVLGPDPAPEAAPDEPMFDYRSGWARGEFFPALRACEDADESFDAKAFMSKVVGREVTSSKELTAIEAQAVFSQLPRADDVHDAEVVEEELPIEAEVAALGDGGE